MCMLLYLNTIISSVLFELVSYANQKIRMMVEREVYGIAYPVDVKGAESFLFSCWIFYGGHKNISIYQIFHPIQK